MFVTTTNSRSPQSAHAIRPSCPVLPCPLARQIEFSFSQKKQYYSTYYLLQTLDGGMYEKVAEYFSILSRTELYTCSASQFSFGKIKEQAMTVY